MTLSRWSALRLCCYAMAGVAATAAHGVLPPSVAEALAEAEIPQTAVAIVVQRVDERAPLIAHQDDAAMNPASVIKLLTTYAGLEILGPAYAWKTEALGDGRLSQGVLNGNLYLRGSGDPKLTIEQFWLLLKRLRSAGVRRINGDVVLDSSYFADAPHDPAEFDAKPNRAYNVAASALLVNYNAVTINLSVPDQGAQVRAWLEPSSGLTLINALKTDDVPCGNWRERVNVAVAEVTTGKALALSGKFSIHCGERTYPLSFFANEEFVRAIFIDLWREMGGRLRGKVQAGKTPESAVLLATLDSPPLADVIRDINKWSNNVMARQLYLTLGAQALAPPATAEKAELAVTRWLAAKGLMFPELVLENGAGLSRKVRISARHLADLLMVIWRSPLMPEMVASLPIVAVDGTMKKRLLEDAAAGQAHIKTGTLDGVRTLSGFVRDRNGKMLAVVSLINHPRAGLGQPAEDALLKWVHDLGDDIR